MVVNRWHRMGNQPHFCASKCGKADRAPSAKERRKSPETQRFQGFSGGRGRRARSCFATPLAVPETADARFHSRRFDRCASPCSLYPPPAARAGVARHAPRASGSSLFRETKKSPRKRRLFCLAGAEGLELAPACGARNGRCSLSLAPFRPLRQPLLAVSATGGASRRCPARGFGAAVGKRNN